MERLDDMRASLETDARPTGARPVRARRDVEPADSLRLPVRVLPPSPARRPAPHREQRLVPTLPRVTPWGRHFANASCKVRHVGEMALHAGFYSAAAKLDVRAMLLDVRSARPGHRNELYHGSLAIP